MNIQKIRDAFLNKTDAALVISPENRFYLTSFSSTDGYYLITADKTILFADSRYIEAARKTAENCDELVLLTTLSQSVAPVLEKLNVRSVMTESDRMTVTALSKLNAALPVHFEADRALDEAVDSLRLVKTEREIALIKKAQSVAEKAFYHIMGFIEAGRTERDISLELDFFMLRNGADALSFETIAVSGVNSSMPHGVPTDKKIEPGDFITMDYGAVCGGYHSDMTRTVALGRVSDEQVKVYETVLKAQQAAFPTIKPGVCCRDVDAAAREVIKQAGYGNCFGHGLGHGVGVEIHEAPTVSHRGEMTLVSGCVITNEPGIYIEGRFGVRIEDMVLVRENGYENLTSCPKNLIVL